MKKKLISAVVVSCLFCTLFLSGCSDNSAGDYVGKQIKSLKEKDAAEFTALLESGIKESNKEFILQFPEELKEPYLNFLQSAFSSVSFEASSAKKKDNSHYTVDLTFTPINVGNTLKEADTEYAASMTDPDLTASVSTLLKKDAPLLKEAPVYEEETYLTVDITKEKKGYSLSEKSITSLLKTAITNYMSPYNSVCELLDTRDFLQAYLDASCKGDLTQFMAHTQKSAEEAQAWYDSAFTGAPEELSDEQEVRYVEAFKNILKQSQYTVGIPKKNGGAFNYTIDVTYPPNNSITDAMQAYHGGTYYSMAESTEAAVQALESYANAPTFGPEATTTVNLNLETLINSGKEDSELTNLIFSICPMPE